MTILNKFINPIINFKFDFSAHAKIYLAIVFLYIVSVILCAMENYNYHMRKASGEVLVKPVFQTRQGSYKEEEDDENPPRQYFPVEITPYHFIGFAFIIIVPTLFIDFIYKNEGKVFASVLVLGALAFLIATIIRQSIRYNDVLSQKLKPWVRTKGSYSNAIHETNN